MAKPKGGLTEWFKQDWVDIGSRKKGGGFAKCGRSKLEKDRKRKYPKCVPAAKAARMSDKEIKSAVRRKRAKKQGVGGKPTNVKTFARDGGAIMPGHKNKTKKERGRVSRMAKGNITKMSDLTPSQRKEIINILSRETGATFNKSEFEDAVKKIMKKKKATGSAMTAKEVKMRNKGGTIKKKGPGMNKGGTVKKMGPGMNKGGTVKKKGPGMNKGGTIKKVAPGMRKGGSVKKPSTKNSGLFGRR